MRSLPELEQGKAVKTTVTGQALKHESAERHVSGQAIYTDDMALPQGALHASVGYATIACGRITRMDLDAVRSAPGVVKVITVEDIPGKVDIGAIVAGDPLLTSTDIRFHGQAVFMVVARTELQARRAVQLAQIDYEEQTPLLDIEESLAKQDFVTPSHTIRRGDVEGTLDNAPHRLSCKQHVGGQEHFYLEGQVSWAQPTETGGMVVYASNQHPSEVQKLVAEVLGVTLNYVTVDMRRMGGGFGGKESQAAQWACLAALGAHYTGKAVKLRLSRADDMPMTGKRHPFFNTYDIGFDDEGRILAADLMVAGNCGHSPDLSDGIVDRAMFHADNAYYLDQVQIVGHRCRTNTVSNTAFRGFGGPQGMLLIERAMDDIARTVGKDPLDVRKLNLYGDNTGLTTPYGQKLEQDVLGKLIAQLEESSDYRKRREEIRQFNAEQPILKRGLALTPLKFGISFTAKHLNQGGALLHVYTDGSVQINHGGTEMGQGLHTKVMQIVAEVFGIDINHVAITATRTDKVPNTSPTAASSGTDLNGKAAYNAAMTVRNRMVECLATIKGVDAGEILFSNGQVYWSASDSMSFEELAQLAYVERVSLSATGYYATPKIHYDRETGTGHPFFYFANGAAVSEVVVDTLTGEYKVLRADILHDVGRSLNPAIDIGQIEGGYIQGMGWLTTEELKWDAKGRLLTTGPATYKIPAISDLPKTMNISLYAEDNAEDTIYYSKAVGEPPFMLAISVWAALRDAISSLSDYRLSADLDAPATPERVLGAINAMRKQTAEPSKVQPEPEEVV